MKWFSLNCTNKKNMNNESAMLYLRNWSQWKQFREWKMVLDHHCWLHIQNQSDIEPLHGLGRCLFSTTFLRYFHYDAFLNDAFPLKLPLPQCRISRRTIDYFHLCFRWKLCVIPINKSLLLRHDTGKLQFPLATKTIFHC